MRTILTFTLSLLFTGCATPLPGDVLLEAYKAGTPRANLISLAEQQNFIRFASRSRPPNGWPSKMQNENNGIQKVEVFAADFERKNPNKIVYLSEAYLVPPKQLALSIPDPSGDTLDEYHYWFFDAKTNLLGHTIHYDHFPLTWK